MLLQEVPVILDSRKHGLLCVEDNRVEVLQLSRDGRPPKCLVSCPIRLVLRARLTLRQSDGNARLDLHMLGQRRNTSHNLNLLKIHFLVDPSHVPEAEQWIEGLMSAAYPTTRPYRKVLLLVNPVGGKGKARSVVKETVLPILEAAGCLIELQETTHRLHAEQIAKQIELQYDVIATASGDGLIYEVLNGLASRPDAYRALRTAIAPIPTGSACAACTNLFGVKDTFNVPLATLNIIKGQHLPIDLCSVLLLPSLERRFSFISQALGLMVDLDIGTEHLRWMGDSRFMFGFLKGIVANKNVRAKLRLNVTSWDKVEMVKTAREAVLAMTGENIHKTANFAPLNLITGVQRDARVQQSLEHPEQVSDSKDQQIAIDTTDSSTCKDGPFPEPTILRPDASWLTIETGEARKRSNSESESTLLTKKETGWVEGDGILYVYSGMMPWVARDLMQWPVATSGQGVIDMVVQSIVPRHVLVNAITGAEKGDAYWMECQHYFKVKAFTAENLDKKNQPTFTIDGEAFPFDTFHVEVVPQAARLLSLDGRFFVSEFLQKEAK